MNEEKKEALRREFSALLDNELDPESRATVEAELAEDAELLRELEAMKKVDALYRALPRHAAPEGFEARVHAALAENVVPISRFRNPGKWLAPVLAFAATLLIISGVFFQVQKNPTEESFNISQAPAQVTTETDAKEKAAVDAKSPERQRADTADSSGAAGNETMKTDALAPGAASEISPLPEPVLAEKKQLADPAGDDEMNGRANTAAPIIATEPQAEGKPMMKMEAPKDFAAGKNDTPMSPPPPASAPLTIAAEAPSIPRDLREEETPQAAAPEMESPAESNGFGVNSLALGAPMKDEDKGAVRRPQSTESPLEYFRMLKEHRARTKELRESMEQVAPRNVAGRTFQFEQSVWVESTYNDEEVEYVEKGSDAYDALAGKEPVLLEISQLGQFVLVSLDKAWVFIYSVE